MKKARPFIVLDVVLATALGLFLLLKVVNDKLMPLPLYAERENWTALGWAVLVGIVMVGCLTVGLMFLEAINKPVPQASIEERGSKSRSWEPVLALIGLAIAVLAVVIGVQSGHPTMSFVFAFFMLMVTGFPICKVLKGPKRK